MDPGAGRRNSSAPTCYGVAWHRMQRYLAAMASRPHAALPTALLVIALAVLVAVASRSSPAWTLVRTGPAYRPAIFVDVAAFWVIGMLAAAVVATVLHRTLLARRAGAPALGTMLVRAAPVMTLVLATVSLLMIARMELAGPPEGSGRPIQEFHLQGRSARPFGIVDWRDPAVRSGDGEREERTGRVIPGPFGGVPQLPLLVGVVLLVLSAAALTWTQNRRKRLATLQSDDAEVGPERDVVRDAVVDTIDAMIADPDPNTAVIGAYARLLEGLAVDVVHTMHRWSTCHACWRRCACAPNRCTGWSTCSSWHAFRRARWTARTASRRSTRCTLWRAT
jgi:hypothetical protein